MFKRYRYRIYPSKKQEALIERHFAASRLVYNLALECKQIAYSSLGKTVTMFDLLGQVSGLIQDNNWLKELDSQSLRVPIINLNNAFSLFYNGHSRYPKYKSKKKSTPSFTSPHKDRIEIRNGRLFQPKFRDGIKIKLSREIKGEIRSSTIKRTKTGQYYVTILSKCGENAKKDGLRTDGVIGIDLGLKTFVTTSNGDKINSPEKIKKSLSKIKYLHKKVSKKQRGSNNKKKCVKKLAKEYQKVVNIRMDFLHKLSSKLVSENQTLCFEDLNIKGMMKNKSISRSVADSGWGMFVEMCKYKSNWNDKNLIQIGRFVPSSKKCSNCEEINNTLTLDDRSWACAKCGVVHDRDINAAINIKNIALNLGSVSPKKSAEVSLLKEPMKQKAIKKNSITIDINFTQPQETF